MTNDKKVLLGSALAAFTMAAGCAMGGMKRGATTGSTTSAAPATTAQSTLIAKGECAGINACKGQGECGGAGHGCAGKNTCKGQGWVSKTESDCKAAGGTFTAK